MTLTTKRRIAREWLMFLMCILIGLSATYFAVYFPVQYVGRHFVEVTDAQSKDFLNNQYRADGIIPEGYRTTNSFFDPHWNDRTTYEEMMESLKDRRLYTFDWEHEESFYRHKNPGELFSDLGKGHLWTLVEWDPISYIRWPLWLCVLSPYLALLFVRSVIWSVNALRRS